MNADLQTLQPYPFEKLRALLEPVAPPDKPPIALSVGEPRHPSPAFVQQAVTDNLARLANYPVTRGETALREAIAGWAQRRFQLQGLDPERQLLPVNGTREALFSFTQAVIDRRAAPLVVSPNPFYQIYEGAALLAGAEPYYLPCEPGNGFVPDFERVPAEVWRRCQLLFLCTPGNPTGAVMDLDTLQRLIRLADEHDFTIASDECYSEIYFDESQPPPGLLQAAAAMGRHDYRRCVVFHSLSKRSNLPGLRSGFVAGDADMLAPYLLYRTYHGCAMPPHHQLASVVAWGDEAHVVENRRLYRQKFDRVLEILGDALPVQRPDASFYLWPQTPVDDRSFAAGLFGREHVTVLPGSYLGREVDGVNPGANRVRMALVAGLEECVEAAQRIKNYVEAL